MSIYSFVSYDQPRLNWLVRVTAREGGYGVRFRHLKAFCGECHRFDHDVAFSQGFDRQIPITVRKGRNILQTDDHFLCVSSEIVQKLLAAGVGGFDHTPLPETPWSVLRITQRMSFDPTAFRAQGRKCAKCSRVDQFGQIMFERQIEVPSHTLTFFSTNIPRGQGFYDLFVTEPLVQLMKEIGVRGLCCHRLFTSIEEPQLWPQLEKQPSWRPKGSTITL